MFVNCVSRCWPSGSSVFYQSGLVIKLEDINLGVKKVKMVVCRTIVVEVEDKWESGNPC